MADQKSTTQPTAQPAEALDEAQLDEARGAGGDCLLELDGIKGESSATAPGPKQKPWLAANFRP